jgi:tetratricopeptide (TPR) repeat protein
MSSDQYKKNGSPKGPSQKDERKADRKTAKIGGGAAKTGGGTQRFAAGTGRPAGGNGQPPQGGRRPADGNGQPPQGGRRPTSGIAKGGGSARRGPESEHPGDRSPAQEQRLKKLRMRIVIFSVLGTICLVGAAACVYYFGFVHPNDNYDAQMKIGAERYEAGIYEEAEAAFLKALEYKPGDTEATIALADTYTAWEKFDKAIILLTALQDIDESDTRTYERLISIYIHDTKEIPKANEQILKAYELEIDLEHEAITAAPVFAPKGGVYNEVINVTLTAGEGEAIYYTTDGSIPTRENTKYEEALVLKNKEPIVVTAVVIAEDGLIGWPAKAEYSVNIQYAIDSEFLGYIGKSAAEIMGSAGALFYVGEEGGGYYYRNKSSDCFFVFPWEVFQREESDETTDGEEAPPPDPNRTPLPGDAVCVAVSMQIGRLFVQMEGTLSVEDLMAGLNVESYSVETSGLDGLEHLYYSANGYSFDYTLKDATTVGSDGEVVVRHG